MLMDRLALSIVDGLACVAWTTSDYSSPKLITNHWPTKVRARDLANAFDVSEVELLACEVLRAYAGEYSAKTPRFHVVGALSVALTLVNGGQTQPIKTDLADCPPPKTRVPTEYRDGHWWKALKSGWVRCS